MTQKEFEQLKQHVAETIKITVNGKIDKLNDKIDNYIKEDNEWKEKAEPVIEMGINARGASAAVLWIAGIVIAVGGAWLMIRNLFFK